MRRSNFFWGIICLVLAAFIILSFSGVVTFPLFEGISTGKFIATLIFLIIIISSLASLSIEPIIVSIGVLAKLYEEQLGIQISVPMLVFTIILLIMAYHFLFPQRLHKKTPKQDGEPVRNHENAEELKTNVSEDDGDYIECKNYFNGITKYVNSKNFCGGSIDSAFGGTDIYFTNTKVPSGHATLNISAKFGGVSIYVPYNWKITNHVNAVMGAVSETPMSLRDDETYPVELELTGNVSFSGVDINRI